MFVLPYVYERNIDYYCPYVEYLRLDIQLLVNCIFFLRYSITLSQTHITIEI